MKKRNIIISLLTIFLLHTGCKEEPIATSDHFTLHIPEYVMEWDDNYKTIFLYLDAPSDKRGDVWIDKNGNKEKDPGEAVSKFGMMYNDHNEFKIASKEVNIYGDITKVSIRESFRFWKFDAGTNTTITYLDLNTNFIEEINIDGLRDLEYLSLHRSTIDKPIDLSKHTKLKVLDLGYVDFFKMEDINMLKQLEYLDVSGRGYTGFTGMALPKLKTLLIRDNRLRGFDASLLPELERLDISGCDFADVGDYISEEGHPNYGITEGLEALYRSLPDRTGKSPGLILIKGNPGAGFADHTIAEKRNWKVDDTSERLEPVIDREHMDIEKW